MGVICVAEILKGIQMIVIVFNARKLYFDYLNYLSAQHWHYVYKHSSTFRLCLAYTL